MIGQIVNYRYEVLEKIGDGVLFSVYKARDKVMNRLVALKVLNKELMGNREFADAVRSGYQAVISLAHPNTARVFEAECSADICFVAMEYARGINVKDRIRRAGPISAPLVLEIIIPVLEALDYAHSNRIVHGDIRSQDIVVSPDSEVKLTDFGLSYALRRCPDVADKHIMRSVHYQAPEVIEGGTPTPASDIYSIGVVLYEMLTGSLPFDGPTATAIALKKVRERPVPPKHVNMGIPQALNDIVLRALEQSPEQRFPNAAAMLEELRAVRDSLRVGAVVTSIPQASPKQVYARAVEKPVEEHRPAEEPAKTKFFIWLIVLFAATVLISLGLTIYISGITSKIQVPNFLGKTWDEAQLEAEKVGIKLVDDGRGYSDLYEEGKIYAQNPTYGKLISKDNPVVKVKISNGPSRIKVPDLTGLPEIEASQVAARENFTIGKVVEEYNDKVPIGAVIRQDPMGGLRRPPGTPITIYISRGPRIEQPEPEDKPEVKKPINTTQTINMEVIVPDTYEGPQVVRIIVNDDRGERTVYERTHEPGDSITKTITVTGTARVRVYVGDNLERDETY